MSLIDTSDWVFRRKLGNLKRLLEEGLISEDLYKRHLERAMDWRGDRLYSKAQTPSSTSRTAKRTKVPMAPPQSEG
jgi:hypothetical protein